RLQPRAGAGERCAHKIRTFPPSAAPALGPRVLATEHAYRRRSRRQDCAPPVTVATNASRPRSPNPHRSRPTQRRPFPPAVSSLGGNHRLWRAIIGENGGGAGRFVGAFSTPAAIFIAGFRTPAPQPAGPSPQGAGVRNPSPFRPIDVCVAWTLKGEKFTNAPERGSRFESPSLHQPTH